MMRIWVGIVVVGIENGFKRRFRDWNFEWLNLEVEELGELKMVLRFLVWVSG